MDKEKVHVSRWLVSLGMKFGRVVPVQTAMVIMLTLSAQISYILAFFLPLKIIILLGASEMPTYLPSIIADLGRDQLVILLSIATLGFFVINSVSEKLIGHVTEGVTALLMSRNQKMVLFENQDEVAANAYQNFVKGLAGIVFALLAIGLLLVIYPETAFLIAIYVLVAGGGVFWLYEHDGQVTGFVKAKLDILIVNLSVIGFFILFAYMIVDFIWLEPPSIIIAIIAILAGRQTFTILSGAVKKFDGLYRQHQKLDALFFHGRPLLVNTPDEPQSLWYFLARENRNDWIKSLLKEHAGLDRASFDVMHNRLKWQQPTLSQMGCFLFHTDNDPILIKIYDTGKFAAAAHETALLADMPENLPAPKLLGTSGFEGFRCSVYKLPAGDLLAPEDLSVTKKSLLQKLLTIIPSKELQQRYLRSRPTLVQRMSATWLDRADVGIDCQQQAAALKEIRTHWSEIKSMLNQLPLVFHNPAMSSGNIWQPNMIDSHIIISWENWSLEPAGVGWRASSSSLRMLAQAHHEASAERGELCELPVEYLMLAAVISELERLVLRHQLDEAAKLPTRIWRVLMPLLSKPHFEKHSLND